MLNDAFRKELLKFDAERVLFAWDGLLRKQQATLEGLGVPTMFPSDLRVDREVRIEAATVSTNLIPVLLETTESSSSLGRYSRFMSDTKYHCDPSSIKLPNATSIPAGVALADSVTELACDSRKLVASPSYIVLGSAIPVMKKIMALVVLSAASTDYYMHTRVT
jgi:hypothetical protein